MWSRNHSQTMAAVCLQYLVVGNDDDDDDDGVARKQREMSTWSWWLAIVVMTTELWCTGILMNCQRSSADRLIREEEFGKGCMTCLSEF